VRDKDEDFPAVVHVVLTSCRPGRSPDASMPGRYTGGGLQTTTIRREISRFQPAPASDLCNVRVEWVVQYRIKNPEHYLFKIGGDSSGNPERNAHDLIGDVSEAVALALLAAGKRIAGQKAPIAELQERSQGRPQSLWAPLRKRSSCTCHRYKVYSGVLRTALTGLASNPISFKGKAISSYIPSGTPSSTSPSRIAMSCFRQAM